MRYLMLGRLFGFALMLIVVGCAWVYRTVDTWLSYERTMATVTAVGETCRPEARAGALAKDIDNNPNWGDERWGDCAAAARYAALRPGVIVRRSRRVDLHYVSPADKLEHYGSIRLDGAPGAGAIPRAGGRWEILASSRDARDIGPL